MFHTLVIFSITGNLPNFKERCGTLNLIHGIGETLVSLSMEIHRSNTMEGRNTHEILCYANPCFCFNLGSCKEDIHKLKFKYKGWCHVPRAKGCVQHYPYCSLCKN